MPYKVCYFEIKKLSKGCMYSSLGVCTMKGLNRNGTDQNGWAVRISNNQTDFNHTGSIHNNQSNFFYNGWKAGDCIGILFYPIKKQLSYFINKKYVGTPFNNV